VGDQTAAEWQLSADGSWVAACQLQQIISGVRELLPLPVWLPVLAVVGCADGGGAPCCLLSLDLG